MFLDIQIFPNGHKEQAKYLVHLHDDVLWTDSIDDAVIALRADLEVLAELEK